MTQHEEIPSDATVVALLNERGALSPQQLVNGLAAQQYDVADSRRAIQRCLNRGLIRLTGELNIEATPTREAVAA